MTTPLERFLKEQKRLREVRIPIDNNHETKDAMIKVMWEALEFYADPSKHKINKENDINEYGCGCCAGRGDKNGICDYDQDVVGETARNCLDKIQNLAEEALE